MPILPVLMKIVQSSLVKGAAKAGVASAAGKSFGEHYTADFAKGVGNAMSLRGQGVRDGQRLVNGFKQSVTRLFFEIPKEVSKRRWGEHLAGALVKTTGARLASMNANLAAYGGSAQTYAQTMTSLADKAFKLGFGEANWIPQLMKYTLGEYDPFGSGENGFKTKEENLEWFKDRYNGRKDLTDEARTVGGILGITPDIVKLILDGHRDLLERENHLTAEEVKNSNELAYQSARTTAAWQEAADLWGAKIAPFWTGWEKIKGGFAGLLVKVMEGTKTEEDIAKDYEERAKGIFESVGKGDRGFEKKEDAANWRSLAYHMTKGSGQIATDEELAALAKAQADAGVGDVVSNLARLREARANPNRSYVMNENVPLTQDELNRAKTEYELTSFSQNDRKRQADELARKRRKEIEGEKFENDINDPRYMEGVLLGEFGLIPDREKLKSNLEKYGASQKVREYFETASWWQLKQRAAVHGIFYNQNLDAEHKAELDALGKPVEAPLLTAPYGMESLDALDKKFRGKSVPYSYVPSEMPLISSTGVTGDQYGPHVGNVTINNEWNDNSNVTVNSTEEAGEVRQKTIEAGREAFENVPPIVQSLMAPATYNGSVNE